MKRRRISKLQKPKFLLRVRESCSGLRTSDERALKQSCLPADMLLLRDAMLVVFSDSERALSGTSANPLAAH